MAISEDAEPAETVKIYKARSVGMSELWIYGLPGIYPFGPPVFDMRPDNPPRKKRTVYRAPEPDHAAHIARAQAKRDRKAAKLRQSA